MEHVEKMEWTKESKWEWNRVGRPIEWTFNNRNVWMCTQLLPHTHYAFVWVGEEITELHDMFSDMHIFRVFINFKRLHWLCRRYRPTVAG